MEGAAAFFAPSWVLLGRARLALVRLWFKYLNLATSIGAFIFMLLQDRFKAERERLGFTQPQVAALTAVGKTTVINWEKGASSPTAAQLEVLSKFGMDVLFVVTGEHAGGVQPAPTLTADEHTLLDYYRQATVPVRRAAMGALIGAASASSGQVMQNMGSNNVQVGHVGGSFSSSPDSAKKRTKQ